MTGESTTGQHPLAIAATLTQIERLQRERGYRDAHGRFFVEGIRNVVTAIDTGYPLDALVYSERLLTSPIARKLVRRLRRVGTPFARVSPEQFRLVSRAEQASGVGAILHQTIQRLDQTMPGTAPCWIVLSQTRAPGNVGTLLRTAAAIGAAGFILLGDSIDP